MRKSRVFKRCKEDRFAFQASNQNMLWINMEGYALNAVDIPKTAQHIQIVCTVKKTKHSSEMLDAEFWSSDFVNNVMPKKEKYFHVVYW